MAAGTIEFIRTTTPRQRPNPADLGFGKYFADHMLVLEYEAPRGWGEPRIVPYGPLSLDPAASVLHYGQAMFEGQKAFRQADGRVALFRIDDNLRRLASGAPRLSMPVPDLGIVREAITALVSADRDWVPEAPGTALYLRPVLIGTEAFLGVRPSSKYLFYVISSPVGAYYAAGLKPVKIWVETESVRAIKGGIGWVKAAANYVASLHTANEVRARGYEQVLWLDAVAHRHIEEVGTMNLFVVLGNELATPPLAGSILPGITRDTGPDAGARLGPCRVRASGRVRGTGRCQRCRHAARGLRVRHRRGHLVGRRARTRGRLAAHQRRRDRPARPAVLRRDHQHSVPAGPPTRTDGSRTVIERTGEAASPQPSTLKPAPTGRSPFPTPHPPKH